MSEPIVVSIEHTTRRRIILAALTEHWPFDLIELSEEKKKISDLEVRWFVESMTADERQKAYRAFAGTFLRNANAALARLSAKDPVNYPQPKVGRGGGTLLENLQPHERSGK